MGRTRGSKNQKTLELEKLQQKVYELENSKQFNTYEEVVNAFVDGFIMDLQDNIKTISLDTLQKWFNNPDKYIENISNLLTYYYIIDGNIFQLYDLLFSLPELNYKIITFDKSVKSYKNDIAKIKQILEKQVLHKQLTRDLIVQLAHDGTLLGTWLGTTAEPYFYTFDNLEYVYPYGRYKGKMIGVIDLKWFDSMKTDEERQCVFNNLKPLVTQLKYNKWKQCNDTKKKKQLQYITLPIEKSLVARTHTLNRNQRLGVPYGTQTLFDMQHKQKMKQLERAIADKIIRAIAVLKFKGKDDNDVKVKEGKKKQVFSKVKKALEKNGRDKSGITVIGIPDFASFEFPEFKDADKIFDDSKYKSANFDIENATSISPVLTSGQEGNYASAKLNLDIIYSKIGVLLEIIEEIYNQLITIVLGNEKGSNYMFVYDKKTPLEKSKRVDTLMKLQANGFATSYVLDELGIDPEEYFEESVYEIEVLKLREKIIPPQSTYTQSGDSKPSNSNGENINDNTISSIEQGSNKKPKANI